MFTIVLQKDFWRDPRLVRSASELVGKLAKLPNIDAEIVRFAFLQLRWLKSELLVSKLLDHFLTRH